ncbi:MAG: GNAT family N-acetyltransferase [Candidatus Omnitrophica bacterium]|nr:GNAT family N-acetyltransferase [Candidatus Omnitrophota bacterium]
MVKTLPLEKALELLSLPGLSGNLFSSPDWMTVIRRTYQTNIYVKYVEKDNKITSYVFYSVVQNFLEWKLCICSYCDYSDGNVINKEDWQAIIGDLRKEYPAFRIAIRNLRDEFVREVPELEVLSRERFHYLDLTENLDDLWRKTNDSFRAAVNQAKKKGVTVKVCDKSFLPKFYNMHLNIRRQKYRIFPQPYRFFDIVWQEYIDKGKGVMLGAFDPMGDFIAANIYLFCGDQSYYKFNTSSLQGLKWRPNNLLFWEGIQLSKERNLTLLDLGSSGYEQKGLILFKNHTGAQCQDIIHLGFSPPGYQFSQKRVLRLMTKTFTLPWMPDFMVKWGSNIIYPYLA